MGSEMCIRDSSSTFILITHIAFHASLHPSFAEAFFDLHTPVVRRSLSRTMVQHGQCMLQPSPMQHQLQPCGYYPGPVGPHVVSTIQLPCGIDTQLSFMQHSHMQPSPMQHQPQFPPPHGYYPANVQGPSGGIICLPSPADVQGPSSGMCLPSRELTDETGTVPDSFRVKVPQLYRISQLPRKYICQWLEACHVDFERPLTTRLLKVSLCVVIWMLTRIRPNTKAHELR